MTRLAREQEGLALLYTALLLPTFLILLASVVELGALRVTRARLVAAADLAATAATTEQDLAALGRDGRYQLSTSATSVARDLLARELEPLAPRLAPGVTAQGVAGAADIRVLAPGEVDPVTRRAYDAPTVRLSIRVPVRTPLLAFAALREVTEVRVVTAASAR